MHSDRRLARLLAILTVALALGIPRAAIAQNTNLPTYVVTDIGTFQGTSSTRGYAVNNFGQVVGDAPISDDDYAVAWHWQNGDLKDMAYTVHFTYWFPNNVGEAYDVSDADQVVGGGWYTVPGEVLPWRDVPLDVMQAYVARPATSSDFSTPYPGDGVTSLGAFGADIWLASCATAISNANHVVGWADLDIKDPPPNYNGNVYHAFVVVPQGDGFYVDANSDGINDVMIDLGTLLSGDEISSATDVNDSGWVVGYSYGPGTGYSAFLIQAADPTVGPWANLDANNVNSLMQSLGTLGSDPTRVRNSWARGINNAGVIVGEADNDNLDTHAFVWQNGTMTDLGTLGGDDSSASAINANGVVVGWAETTERERHAAMWTRNADTGVYEIVDINDRVILTNRWTLVEARDINDSGEVTGWGNFSDSDGGYRAYLLENATAEDLAQVTPAEGTTSAPTTNGTTTNGMGSIEPPPLEPVETGVLNEQETSNVTPVAPLCGFGFFQMLPLTLLGIGGMKLRTNRRR